MSKHVAKDVVLVIVSDARARASLTVVSVSCDVVIVDVKILVADSGEARVCQENINATASVILYESLRNIEEVEVSIYRLLIRCVVRREYESDALLHVRDFVGQLDVMPCGHVVCAFPENTLIVHLGSIPRSPSISVEAALAYDLRHFVASGDSLDELIVLPCLENFQHESGVMGGIWDICNDVGVRASNWPDPCRGRK